MGLTCSHERARLSPSTVFKLQYELKNSTLNTSDSKRDGDSERATSPKHKKETKSHFNAQQHVPSGRPRLILYLAWEQDETIPRASPSPPGDSRRCRGHPCSPSMCFNVVISLKIQGASRQQKPRLARAAAGSTGLDPCMQTGSLSGNDTTICPRSCPQLLSKEQIQCDGSNSKKQRAL